MKGNHVPKVNHEVVSLNSPVMKLGSELLQGARRRAFGIIDHEHPICWISAGPQGCLETEKLTTPINYHPGPLFIQVGIDGTDAAEDKTED